MKLSGHQIIRNGVKYGYPFIESCLSVLSICDEFIFLEGFSDDNTYDELLKFQSKHPDKIKIIREKWDMSERVYTANAKTKLPTDVLSEMTNLCIENTNSEWHLQTQADECYHENDLPKIQKLMEYEYDYYFFNWLHFFKTYYKTYKPEQGHACHQIIRLARKDVFPRLRSYGDAMSLGCPEYNSSNLNGCKQKQENITIYHYSKVGETEKLILNMFEKTRDYWKVIDNRVRAAKETGVVDFDSFHSDEHLNDFKGSHPKVMHDRIKRFEELCQNR